MPIAGEYFFSRLRHAEFEDLVLVGRKVKLVLTIEGHAANIPGHLDQVMVNAVSVEYLDALEVAHDHPTHAVDSHAIRGGKLSLGIPSELTHINISLPY
jgi:hypothetical protein